MHRKDKRQETSDGGTGAAPIHIEFTLECHCEPESRTSIERSSRTLTVRGKDCWDGAKRVEAAQRNRSFGGVP